MLEPRLRLGAIILALPLAACASVEERTDARSGTGFSSTTTAGAGQAAQPARAEVTMQGFEPVPKVAVQGGPASLEDGARRAIAAGGSESGAWVELTAGGAVFDARQVRAGGHDFTVLDPRTGTQGATPVLLEQVRIRTGCLTTGQTFSDDGRIAVAMDCS
jgi:hypothetical protein